MDCPITFNGVGGTWTLQSNFAYGKTAIRAMNLTNGTVNGNGFTITSLFASTIATATNTNTLQNISTTLATTVTSGTITANGTFGAFTFTAGSLTLGGALTTAAFTFTAGTLTLSNYTLTATTFAATGATTRTLAYGTGNITCTGSGTAFTQATPGTITITGTPVVNITNAGTTATTVSTGIMTEANATSFNFSGGAYSLTFLQTASYTAKNVSFASGWAGTWAATSTATIYGNLTLSSAMTLTVSASVMTFGGAIASTKTISPAGKNIDFPMTFNSVGSTYQFTSGMIIGATAAKAVIFTNGIFDINNQAITLGFSGSTWSMNTNTIAISNVSSNTTQAFTVTSGTCNLTNCSFGGAVTFTAGTINLSSATSIAGAFTFTAGALNLNNYTFTLGTSFLATGATTRSIAFGTGNIICSGSGTVWDQTTIGTFSYTGTPVVNITNAGTTATTVVSGIATEAQALSFNFSGGAYTLTFLATASHSAKNVYFNPSWTGSLVATSTGTIYGDLTLASGMTLTSSASAMTLGGATTATKNITTNTKSIPFPITFNGTGSTWVLQDNLSFTSTITVTLTSGILNLNNLILTASIFSSSGAVARTIAFGTGKIVINGNATATVWNTATVTNLSYTGTSLVEFIGGGSAVTKTINTGTLTESQAMNFSLIETTGTVTYAFTASNAVKNLLINGSQTISNIAISIYGSVYHYTNNGTTTFTAGANAWTFAATSGTYSFIVLNSFTYDFPWTFGTAAASTATWQINGSFYLGTTRNFTLTNGTVNFNNGSLLQALALVIVTGSPTLANTGATNLALSCPITHTSGTFNLSVNITSTGAYTFTAGTITTNNYVITCASMSATGATTRVINFGTGNITCTGSGTVWTQATIGTFSYTGTPTVNITNSTTTAVTVASGIATEAQALNFTFSGGAYTLTFLNTASYTAKNVTFSSGWTGTWAARTVASTVYGNLTLSTGLTVAASTGVLTLGATSGTQTITSNGRTFDGPMTVNGIGGTVFLADALTLGATRTLLLQNGTFDGDNRTISGSAISSTLAGGSVTIKNISTSIAYSVNASVQTVIQGANNTFGAVTLTAGNLNLAGFIFTSTSFTTGVGTKDVTFNGGTLAISAATTTAFNNANPLNFTTTAGTGTGKISMTAATAKTFVGGGSTYNCTLSNDGAGTLTITGANTFTKLANGVQPTAFVFPSSTTTTVSDFGIDGTAGNLVTITSSTSGTAATLSSATSTIDTYYVSLKDSAATGAVWTAYNSTNVSGNTGWIFSINRGNFFAMFF